MSMNVTIANDLVANALTVALLLVLWTLCVECSDAHRIRMHMSR
jgi:hypothetical protein